MSILDIRSLEVSFQTKLGPLKAVRGIDLCLNPGEIVGLVGESGSGKSAACQAILKLIPHALIRGSVFFHGEDILTRSERELAAIRGSRIGMMFQDSLTALNPTRPIGDQIIEGMIKHRRIKKTLAFQKGVEILFQLGVNHPVERMEQYPHEMSGGIRQRIMLAIAISCQPELLIADEPTTSLDVVTQAQILQLLKSLNISILFITHDLNLISKIADRIYVMYAGKIIESNTTEELFNRPAHPYTKALFESTPNLVPREQALRVIPGSPPSPYNIPAGCPFHPRCPDAMKLCALKDPSQEASLPNPCWKYHPNAPEKSDAADSSQSFVETIHLR